MTLKGFKSFADSTTLQLEPGVTVVVGPNGSGKSNVVDAIAWVLGAQAPSAVRSQKMDDVIFAGTAKRPALGRAEVALTIDNSAGLLPIEFTEVTVSRTLFRSGESEYAINGVNCRLLDVQELLSDAGVGRQQHVIVSQGQIDGVLNARPEDRRAIIEEAAGVLKYRKRREKAARRLDATDASLVRVQDLLREVRRQLRPLERQAEAARRHGELIGELRALQIFLAGREIAGLRTRLASSANARQQAAQRDHDLRAELSALDTAVIAAESELTARGDFDLGDELVRVEQLRERARGVAAVLVERRRSMERDRGQLMDSGLVANLEAEAARVADELDAVSAELAGLEPQAEQLHEDEAAFAAHRQRAVADLDDEAPGSSAASAAAEVRGELRSLRANHERTMAEQQRVAQRIDALAARSALLEGEAARLLADCEAAEGAELGLVAALDDAERAKVAAEARVAELGAARQRVAEEAGTWRARADALAQALEHARARAGAEHLAGIDGVLGTVLDLVEIDAGWEPAVEAALGEALQAVVVASPDAGRAALASLHAADLSGAVLALGATRRATVPPAAGTPVRPHVRARRAGMDGVLDAVLGGAVRVDSWSDAVEAILHHPDALIVTDHGDRFGSSGWRIGVAGAGATAAALTDAAERADRAAAELDACDQRLMAAHAAQQAALRTVAEAIAVLDDHDARFSATSERLARTKADHRDTSAELESLHRSATDTASASSGEAGRLAELEGLLPGLEADEAAETEAARRRHEVRTSVETAAAELRHRRQQLELRRASLDERRQLLTRRAEETERRLQTDQEARARSAQRRQVLERSLGAVDRLAALVDGHRRSVEARHAVLSDLRRRQSDEVRAIASRLDEARRTRQATERQLDELREHSRRLDVDEAELRLRLEAAVETLRRDHDLEPHAAESAEQPALPEGVPAPARARELERELRLLGPINPLALEEFNELQQRHAFLEEQLEDVRSTRRELLRVIRAVDQEIQSVFAAAYADVSGHFTTLFSSLFPGGAGRLILTNPDDLLNTGIEIEAKPSGKNVKKLSLLSGGERSLTALAYLFAVFRSRPSPFYVMDEVEAALDDVNLHRFLGLIAEFRAEAQLLIVSHQKRTMEAGDCLLGVTMQPGGSSKVVTERVTTS